MPRPIRCRRIQHRPSATYFKPAGIRIVNLKEVMLNVDEYEAVRLVDLEEIEQVKAAVSMKISQPTFSRLLKSGRNKIADALVNGKAIKIQGGNFKMVNSGRLGFGRRLISGGRGRMGGTAEGPGGICKCPNCGYEEKQIRGEPCVNKKCPKCGARMTRK